ncbi:MAG: 3-methyl-2-oxobutanoate hydroxymethyltransferase [Candidatus Omnitrophica bacterium]|nr:3-methyl-2-oxobutanoate hydroxymethyltransferase [Candidatus Omnitrophota bacterium]
MTKDFPKKISSVLQKAKAGEKITMLTAYDFSIASVIDQCGIDVILVGDSLANVVLGLQSTKEVGMTEMLHHAKAVRRAVKNALLIGDMPFNSYQLNPRDALKNAKRFVDEAGCDGVKIEWFDHCLDVSEEIIKAGIPVVGHVGLTPQTADKLGGFKVQGKDAAGARRIIDQAQALENKGCFSIVLECIPENIAAEITQILEIPTIGIGAGPKCDGQVLVTHDLLGLVSHFHPKFAKQYVDVASLIKKGIKEFSREVKQGKFPDQEHSYRMSNEQLKMFKSISEE